MHKSRYRFPRSVDRSTLGFPQCASFAMKTFTVATCYIKCACQTFVDGCCLLLIGAQSNDVTIRMFESFGSNVILRSVWFDQPRIATCQIESDVSPRLTFVDVHTCVLAQCQVMESVSPCNNLRHAMETQINTRCCRTR